MSSDQHVLAFNPYHALPDPPAALYAQSFVGISPYEFTDWRDETCSWKTTCYLHAGLNPTDTYVLKGPDVIEYLSRITATNMDHFEPGRIKHGLILDDEGRIVADGVMMRTAEDEVWTYWMAPLIQFPLESGQLPELELEGKLVTADVFLFQIGGPVSIDVIEAATGESFRDMRHLRFRNSTIAGHEVQVCRVGMAGTLAYEVHGNIADAQDVYQALWEAGQPLGMRRLGSHCYPMNHAENGFPQYGVHFLEPRAQIPGLMGWLQGQPGMEFLLFSMTAPFQLLGSAGDDINNYYHNPYELGWGKMIHFDHDFQGREACERLAAEDKRHIVTLEWDAQDIAEVFASQFMGTEVEPYKYIEHPTDMDFWPDMAVRIFHDKVLNKDGEVIGMSFGRQNSCYFRRMISICTLDKEYAQEGTEVFVLWGDPGTKQKRIRARVARYPYNNVMRSSETDVSKL